MKKFKKTYIEITNKCNLSCDFCPKTSRHESFMSSEAFREILIKIQGYSKFLYFHVMGEPLMHPEIGLFLDISQEYGFKVNITTNGTLIDKVGDSIISKPALRQVNFSLHSFEANQSSVSSTESYISNCSVSSTESYISNCSVNSTESYISNYPMDKYLDRIFSFIERSIKERELSICLRLWNLSGEGSSEKNRYILERIKREFKLDFTIEDKLTPCNGIKLAQNIFLNQASEFEWPDLSHDEIDKSGFCYGLRDQLAILVDGSVVPCCLDRDGAIKLGNIYEQNFEEIIKSERAKKLYDGFSNREAVEELCRKCGYRGRFGN